LKVPPQSKESILFDVETEKSSKHKKESILLTDYFHPSFSIFIQMTLLQKLFLKKTLKTKIKKSLLYKCLLLLRVKLMVRERNYVTCACLRKPHAGSWNYLYRNGSNKNFINVTSLTKVAFHQLLTLFAPLYEDAGKWRPGGCGRPRKLIESHAVLGLLLAFYSDSCGMKALCLQFGLPPATACRTLKQAEVCLLACLTQTLLAAVKWPTRDEQVQWAELAQKKTR